MAAYMTLVEFKARTVIPPSFIDAVETVQPGFTLAQLESWSRYIDLRLGKRYRSPFAAPVPEAIKAWLVRLVTLRVWLRRGVDPQDEQFATVKEDSDTALTELKEAADSSEGLFDLPLTDSEIASGITYGGPRVYSEQSPYVASDVQRETGYYEDGNRRGTGVP